MGDNASDKKGRQFLKKNKKTTHMYSTKGSPEPVSLTELFIISLLYKIMYNMCSNRFVVFEKILL